MQELNHEGHEEREEGGREEGRREEAGGEEIARQIVDSGLKIHRQLGPGLLESAYEHCLAHELSSRGMIVQRQLPLPIFYDGTKLDAGYRMDMVVNSSVIIEIKAVEELIPIHKAQIITYLKLSGYRIGFLMNFNVNLFRDGLKRFIR